jgi:hypothetical protein
MNTTALTTIGREFYCELEIQKQCEDALNHALEKVMLEHVNPLAATSFLEYSKGEMSGEIGGHRIAVFNKGMWHYSSEIDKLKERQKAELKSRQLSEQASGEAIQIMNDKPELKITLHKG